MSDSWYDTAQICKNGHLVTKYYESSPARDEKFCSKCGAETITKCLHCDAKIRGIYHVPGVCGIGSYEVPLYCYSCGEAYPWTEEKIKAIKEFSDETDLSSEDKKIIEDNVRSIVIDSPSTQVSAVRIKKVLSKASGAFAQKLQDMIVDIASETAVKLIKGK
jgi:hypothetical protein